VLKRANLHLLRTDAYTRIGLLLAGAFGAYSLGANNIGNVMGVFIPASPFTDFNVLGLFYLSSIQQLFLLGAIAIARSNSTQVENALMSWGNDVTVERGMMKRIIAGAMLLGALLTGAPAALAGPNLPFEAFFGHYIGGGIASNEDSLFFAVTARDFDVTIAAAEGGFRVDWTSVIRRGGTPDKPRIRRKSATKVLMPTANASVFHGTESGDPLAGKELCWARITGRTLSVFLMTVDSNGIYELQQYDRGLSGSGMDLVFRSWRGGDRLRTVKGKLVKVAK